MDAHDFRAEFPVLERLAYLNTGTNGPVPRRGFEAAAAELRRELDDGRSGKAQFEQVLGGRETLRERLAGALRCAVEDVALTGSTTDGMATALSALPLVPGDEVITSDVEHPGLHAPLEGARRRIGGASRGWGARAGGAGSTSGSCRAASSPVRWARRRNWSRARTSRGPMGESPTSRRCVRPVCAWCSTVPRGSGRSTST